MVLGFKSPHGPRTPPERSAKKFAGESGRPVPNLNSKPPYKAAEPKLAAAKAQWGDAQLSYFRTISAADDCVGKILDVLDELKLSENTVVIFASDNGYYLGEHTLGDKPSAYDVSLRIPMVLRYPKLVVKGNAFAEMVLNIHLAPTLIDFAGVEIPKQMQGRSWRPLLEGKAPQWRKAWFYEYFFEKGYQGTPTTLAV